MGNFIQQPLTAAAANVASRILSSNGNPLNLPINELPPTGVYRTYLNSNNPVSVLQQVNGYPSGFTPPSSYYIQNSALIPTLSGSLSGFLTGFSNQSTGFPVEAGNYPSNASLNNNTSVNKISRTSMSWSPTNGSPLQSGIGNNSFTMISNSPGSENTYGAFTNTTIGGFTNPFLYIINQNNINQTTGLPAEFGNMPTEIVPNFNKTSPIYTDPSTILKGNNSGTPPTITGVSNVYKSFNNQRQYNFVHNLDTTPENGSRTITQELLSNPSIAQNIYLGSFVQTTEDNEDPTMFGYDIKINFDTSPLFNGSIISFINQFGGLNGDPEIESRRSVWTTFCNQFFKFFRISDPTQLALYNTANYNQNWPGNKSPANATTDVSLQQGTSTANRSFTGATVSGGSVAPNQSPNYPPQKAYYFKKISGLDNLVEGNVSNLSSDIRSMVNYGKDIIKLDLYEDVSINIGYLSMLYKTLSWSRFNGKQIIPENLLRFDAILTITEIRDYVRVVKNSNSATNLSLFADKLSKYNYTLYDCQFIFEKLSHGDDLDLSSPKMIDDLEISFNYKYTTLAFDKFIVASQSQMQQYTIDNSSNNLTSIKPSKANSAVISNGSLSLQIQSENLNQFDFYPKNSSTIAPVTASTIVDALNLQNMQNQADSYNTKWSDYTSSQEPTLNVASRANNDTNTLQSLGSNLTISPVSSPNPNNVQTQLLNNTLNNINDNLNGPKSDTSSDSILASNSVLNANINSQISNFVGTSVKGFFTA